MNNKIEKLAREINALKAQVAGMNSPQLAYSSIEDGAINEYDAEGNLVAVIGAQPDGSHGVVVLDGPEPLRTSDPVVTATALSIAATWDGNFIDPVTGIVDAELPAYEDFKHIEVHVGDLDAFIPSPLTLSGFIPNRVGGTVSVPSSAGQKYVKFVTRALSGKGSVPSTATPVVVPTLVDTAQFEQAQADLDAAEANLAAAQATLDAAFPTGPFDVGASIAQTIKSSVIEYAVNSSETVAPTTGWSTDTPTRTPGTFVWFRTVITYSDDATATSNPALLTGNTGASGSPGIPGTPGADGVTYYTWLKYADTPTTGMSDSPTGKTYMGIAVGKTSATESTNYADYNWSLIQGPQGDQGIPGAPGADGTTTYTWVKYADNASGLNMTDTPTGKTYIGLAFNKTTATESTVATDYQWSLIQGPQGTPAATVSLTATAQVMIVPAAGGATSPATTTVTGTATNTTITAWTYSVDGGAFSATVPAGVSRATNVVTITGSTMTARTIAVRAADANGVADTLTVAKVSDGATGATGGTGPAGADAYTVLLTNEAHVFPGSTTAALAGSTTSTVVAYKGTAQTTATVGTITGQVTGLTTAVTNNGTNAPLITITVTTALTTRGGTLTVPVTVDGKSFTKTIAWSVAFQGTQGSQGIPGTPGADGVTYYTWLKYADSPTTGMADDPTGKTYMGIAVGKTTATESTNYADYNWSLIQGPQGTQGIPGPAGADGTTTYTWVKYASSATPLAADMSDSPTGKTYIGLAFNKTTATESTVPGDYQWSLIQGPQGAAGAPGGTVVLTATSQVLTQPSTGGATTPATSTVTGTAVNTTITVWDYSVDGGAFSTTVPTGASRTGNVVTITGSTMTARTITVRMADAAGVADSMTVARVSNGATGSTGADAYTVLLTNESYSFPAGTSAAVAGSTTTQVLAYKGTVQQAATIGTITGQVTGLTTAVTNNGTTTAGVTITVTTSLTTRSGTLTIPVTVDGVTFTKYFTWSLALTGATGGTGSAGVGITSITPYYLQQADNLAAPAVPTASPPPAPWTTTEPGYVAGTALYRTERIVYTNSTFAYTPVSKVSAYTAATAAMTAANSKNIVTYTDFTRGSAIPANPTTTGRRVGDIHRFRYSDNGEIAAERILNSSNAWVDVKFGDSILTTLDVGKLTAGTAAIETAVINKMSTQLASIIEADIGNLTAINATMDTLVAQSIAGQTGEFINITADQITGGQVDALIGFSTVGKFVAGDATNAAVEINKDGLSIWTGPRVDPANPTIPYYPLSHWGVGENTFSITNTVTPDAVASLSADGDVSAMGLTVAGDPTFAGQPLMGAWENRETDFSGSRNSILWQLPWGIVGTVVDVNAKAGGLVAPTGTEQFLAYGEWDLRAGRQYRVNFGPYRLNITNSTSSTTSDVVVKMYTTYAAIGTTPAVPSTTSVRMHFDRIPVHGETNVAGQMAILVNPVSDVTQRFAVSILPTACSADLSAEATYQGLMWIEDIGPQPAYTGGVAYGSATPALKKYTYYFYADTPKHYQGAIDTTNNGYTFTYNGVRQTGKAVQGRAGGASVPYHTMLRFTGGSVSGSSSTGVTLASAVSGATSVEAKVRLTAAYTARSSVSAKIGWATSDTARPSTSVTSNSVSSGGTTTTALGTTGSNYVKTNPSSLRISVGPGSSSSDVDGATFYGTDGTSSQRVRLQVDVWK